jgi:hypothetical protein
MSKEDKKVKDDAAVDKKADAVDSKVDNVMMGRDPDEYLAETIVKIEGMSLASKRRVCKERAVDCRLYAQAAKIRGDRQDSKHWFNLVWTLSKLR